MEVSRKNVRKTERVTEILRARPSNAEIRATSGADEGHQNECQDRTGEKLHRSQRDAQPAPAAIDCGRQQDQRDRHHHTPTGPLCVRRAVRATGSKREFHGKNPWTRRQHRPGGLLAVITLDENQHVGGHHAERTVNGGG